MKKPTQMDRLTEPAADECDRRLTRVGEKGRWDRQPTSQFAWALRPDCKGDVEIFHMRRTEARVDNGGESDASLISSTPVTRP